MARQKEFDQEVVLDQAVEVFREHGYEGTSAQMLVDAMQIGRQSLYDTFGDKWALYRAACSRYGQLELAAHLEALRSGERAIEGIEAFLERVASEATRGCLGVSSIVEFGSCRQELAEVSAALDRPLRNAIIQRIEAAQSEGDIASDLDTDQLATFLITSLFGLRIAGRGGASREQLEANWRMTMRALR